MASPQKENGHTQIANELLEAILRSPLTQRELKILLCVIRYTYGFNRKSAELSVRYISKSTGIKFQHIGESVRKLAKKNILKISASETSDQGRTLSLQKDYEKWDFNSSQNRNCSQKSDGIVPKKVTDRVPKRVTKKDNNKDKLKTAIEQYLPENLNRKDFIEAYIEWISYSNITKKKLNEFTIKKQLKFLAKQPEPIKCIDQSIRNGWQGLFEIKNLNNGNGKAKNKEIISI